MNEKSDQNVFAINTGTALLLNDRTEVFSAHGSVMLNAGNVVVSRQVYEKLMRMGVAINSG